MSRRHSTENFCGIAVLLPRILDRTNSFSRRPALATVLSLNAALAAKQKTLLTPACGDNMNPVIRSVAHEARRYEPWPQPKARRLPSCMPANWPGRRDPQCTPFTSFRVAIGERVAARGGRR